MRGLIMALGFLIGVLHCALLPVIGWWVLLVDGGLALVLGVTLEAFWPERRNR